MEPLRASEASARQSCFEASNWVPIFRKHTPRTRFIPLPREFADFLASNGPATTGKQETSNISNQREQRRREEYESSESSYSDESSSEPDESTAWSFPGLEKSIDEAIRELGPVMPKLDGVSPHDAVWVNFSRTTMCTSSDDVITLLQCSERVTAHVHRRHAAGPANPSIPLPPVLALRKWIPSITASAEFRCFFTGPASQLTAVSQRHIGGRFPVLAEHDHRASVLWRLSAFFGEAASGRGPLERLEAGYCCVDVAITETRVFVLDVLPFGGAAEDALLFGWDEIVAAGSGMIGRGDGVEDGGEVAEPRVLYKCVDAASSLTPAESMSSALPIELRGAEGLSTVAEAMKNYNAQHN